MMFSTRRLVAVAVSLVRCSWFAFETAPYRLINYLLVTATGLFKIRFQFTVALLKPSIELLAGLLELPSKLRFLGADGLLSYVINPTCDPNNGDQYPRGIDYEYKKRQCYRNPQKQASSQKQYSQPHSWGVLEVVGSSDHVWASHLVSLLWCVPLFFVGHLTPNPLRGIHIIHLDHY